MTNFRRYAAWYDLLYADKDYGSEAAYVAGLLAAQGVREGKILEFGCGTGKHALALSRLGFEVTGVDLSADMVDLARERAASADAAGLAFEVGDFRSHRLGGQVSAVISLFHTMNYQTSDADLEAAFQTAADHLPEDGIFLFDCWYGPAVLSTRPSVRVRHVREENREVYRFSEPTLQADENTVSVDFTLIAREIDSGWSEVVRETHRMRYLFGPEIRQLLARAGFELAAATEWMSDAKPLDDSTWQGVIVARRCAVG